MRWRLKKPQTRRVPRSKIWRNWPKVSRHQLRNLRWPKANLTRGMLEVPRAQRGTDEFGIRPTKPREYFCRRSARWHGCADQLPCIRLTKASGRPATAGALHCRPSNPRGGCLYGYSGIARLSERLETLFERALEIRTVNWPRAVERCGRLSKGLSRISNPSVRAEREDGVAGTVSCGIGRISCGWTV